MDSQWLGVARASLSIGQVQSVREINPTGMLDKGWIKVGQVQGRALDKFAPVLDSPLDKSSLDREKKSYRIPQTPSNRKIFWGWTALDIGQSILDKPMDKFNTKEEVTQFLMDRYGLGRSTILNRLKYLEMKVQSEDGQIFLDGDQLRELDQLNEWIQGGQKLADFPKRGQLVKQEASELTIPSIDLETVGGNGETALAQLLRTAQEQAAGITDLLLYKID